MMETTKDIIDLFDRWNAKSDTRIDFRSPSGVKLKVSSVMGGSGEIIFMIDADDSYKNEKTRPYGIKLERF